jgi:Amt family ammonium transporter
VHGVGGILGSLLVAVLASASLGGAGYGVAHDMAGQAKTQALGVLATVAWSALATFVLAFATRRLVGLRAKDDEIEEGLDLTYHGERAYNA